MEEKMAKENRGCKNKNKYGQLHKTTMAINQL